ncbi:hypothetical protein ONZ43_g2999 [Nemania bipapillata]|uniref:Uncharacterized protein n=1 Tax=Nemania bipapillata TaxID=110536 RepID=A0ACC2IYD4_9PEZI|nr:hypothetical protein ONZ43_g2999 [Nemania bipapillata]
MPPLILHNVPDEELYTGEDGVRRPYAMIWPENDRQRNVPRTRAREINETGSFGKSTRRSRSRTGSAAPKREDANMQSADKVFASYLAKQVGNNTEPSQRQARQDEPKSNNHIPTAHREPVEVILRGYASPSQQYAAINHYEQLAGRICEDYSREPPIEARRYKSDLRDPALTRRQPLTRAEREKVNKVAGGEHWIKVTFESQEAASAALFASPQTILGHLVYAEPYRSLPPMENAAVLDVMGDAVRVVPNKDLSRQPRRTVPAVRNLNLVHGHLHRQPQQQVWTQKGPTFAEKILAFIPLLGWFSGAMIGDEVPRNEIGEFDMNRASLYWKILYWLDYWFRLFGHELVSNDKED